MTARLRSTYDTYWSLGRPRSAATSANAIAPKRNTVNTMSNTPMLASMNVSGSVASISHARTPNASPNNCTPVQRVTQEKRDGRYRTGQPQGRGRFAERCDGKALQPVEEDRLVDVRKAVEQRDHPVSCPQHLARQLRVVCLIRIHQRRRAEFPEHDDPADSRPCGETQPFAGSGDSVFQGGPSYIVPLDFGASRIGPHENSQVG